MNFGQNEKMLATFENKNGSDITKLVLTNYRVALESSGSWFKKVKGLQSITLSSINSANLIVRHNPSRLWISIIGLIIAIGVFYIEVDLPKEELAIGGGVLFIIGIVLYFSSSA